MEVPFFNYKRIYNENREVYLKAIDDTLSKGAYIMQGELREFEEGLCEYLGCKYAFGVADGTAALEMSLASAGIQAGDEVILSSHTFIATAAAVVHSGGVPVVADCLPDSMIDPESVRMAVSKKTRFIMPTQLNGRTCDMAAIQGIADEFGLKIVEDSCQALGSELNGRKAGLFGVAGSYSFYPAKTLGCFGDGGAVVTDSDQVADKISRLRDHGRDPATGKVSLFGRNGRLDNVQAAILNVKLLGYKASLERRREIAAIYNSRLEGIAELLLPPAPSEPNRFDIFQNYEVQAEHREELREFLARAGVGTICQWNGWMLHQFDSLGLRGDAPYAEEMSKRFMLLPMHHLLTDEEVNYVCEQIIKFYEEERK